MSFAMSAVELSIVVPALNEREGLERLIPEIEQICDQIGTRWEVIVVDDGSTDRSYQLLERLAAERPQIQAIRLRRNFGKSAALAAGFDHCAGDAVVTIDGDGQDDPADIPALLQALESADLVSGWKRSRRDPWTRRLASRIFNWFTRRLTGVDLHDMNCGFKAYRSECVHSLEVYGELHRFLPAIAAQQGWRVTEVPVHHRPRRFGRSRFGGERYIRGALDLLTVAFIGRYEYRPLHLFGGLGFGLAGIGFALGAYLTILKIGGESIGRRPLLFLSVLLIVVGVQFLTFGLLAQMMVLTRRERGISGRDPVQIERTLGLERPSAAAADPRTTIPAPDRPRSTTGTSAAG
jgi:glycosyltransferase involved in cell wall biosynthesis